MKNIQGIQLDHGLSVISFLRSEKNKLIVRSYSAPRDLLLDIQDHLSEQKEFNRYPYGNTMHCNFIRKNYKKDVDLALTWYSLAEVGGLGR